MFQNLLQRLLVLLLLHSTQGFAGGYQSGFIPNAGQWPEAVKYRMTLPNGALFLERDALTYVMHDAEALRHLHGHDHAHQQGLHADDYLIQSHALRMRFLNANMVNPTAEQAGETRFNYFIGQDRSKWASGLKAHTTVRYPSLYPSTELVVYSNEQGLKYDLLLEAGADPSLIRFAYEGAESLQLSNGNLIIGTSLGDVIEQKPVVWQMIDGVKHDVDASFAINQGIVAFVLGNYNPNHALTIDPQIVFATYSGAGSDNWGFTATYDNGGNGYSGGIVFGANFPAQTGSFQTVFGGGQLDIGILKYSADGTNALYITFLGGSDMEIPHSMIVNEYDELIVFGTTGSANFPVTDGAAMPTFQGGPPTSFENGFITIQNGIDIFVSRFSSDGTEMLASTFVGGTGNDGFNGAFQLAVNYADEIRGSVWVDKDNHVYVGTSTQSTDFPVSSNAYQGAYGGGIQDGILVKLDASLSEILWATYLGGSEDDGIFYIAVNSANEVVVTGGTVSQNFPVTPGAFATTAFGGVDGFVSKIDSTGSELLASTYIGSPFYDQSYIVGSDNTSHVYLFGQTGASGNEFILNSPIAVPGGNQFITKLNPDLSAFVWSTTFGNATGQPDISPTALLVDVCDKIYVTGWGGSINGFGTTTFGLPTTPDAFQSSTDGNDFYLYVIDNQAQSIEYASFLGGPSSLDHVDGGTSRFDRKGVVYQSICAGCGGLSDLPVTPGAYSPTNNAANCNNALIKFDFESPITVSAFVNADDPVGCAPYTVNFENTSVNADNFSWRLGNQEIATTQNLTYTFETNGTYEVVLIASSGTTCNESDTVSITITVLNSTSSNLPDLEACQGTAVNIGPDGFTEPYFSFSWSPSAGLSDPNIRKPSVVVNENTTYQLIVSAGSCNDTLIQQVTVSSGDFVQLDPEAACEQDEIQIGLSAPIAGATYSWSPTTGLSNATVFNPTLTVSQDAEYLLLATLPEGCTDTFAVQVSALRDTIDAGPTVNACSGQEVNIGLPGNTDDYSYVWTPSTGLSNPNAPQTAANVDETTSYLLTRTPLEGTPGCIASDTVSVVIVPKPLALFGSEVFANCLGVSVQFTDSSENFQTLRWEFSTGEISAVENPLIVFPYNDTLKVTLFAENGECRDTMTYAEFIKGLKDYFNENSSNAFSPNGDGVNDCFSPALQNQPEPFGSAFLECSDLIVYDRWGIKLFDSAFEGGSSCWNGKNKGGEDMPEGVYYYTYQFDGEERAGVVHLRREL